MKKNLVLSYIEDQENITVNLMDVADISFDPDAEFYVEVTLDDGTSYECDYIEIVKV